MWKSVNHGVGGHAEKEKLVKAVNKAIFVCRTTSSGISQVNGFFSTRYHVKYE
jgi:hypothetical protein